MIEEWVIRVNEAGQYWIYTDNWQPIALVIFPNIKTKDEEAVKRNANLIAAAPNLLEALHLLVNTPASDTQGINFAWARASIALAKAKGE